MEKFSYNDCKEYLSTFGLKSSYIFHKKVKEGIFDHINNIQLIRIPFNKKNKISDILSDYLNSMIRV